MNVRQRVVVLCTLLAVSTAANDRSQWAGDLSPIDAEDWSRRMAAHLLERAGFGGTPDEIAEIARLGPRGAVSRLVHFDGTPKPEGVAFDHSGVFDPGLDPFPPSRPATTDAAKQNGRALGIDVKPDGNRPVQPIVNAFFYWLRASRLETDRVAYWWANRMLTTQRPLEEKAALFWHGHFATNEDKVRDYRKMLQQLTVFQELGLGDFRELLRAVSKDPAMLAFLDAGINVKGSPNENFAREIMELFTMGVGNYSEQDIREAARAFTGWNFEGLAYRFNAEDHDAGEKTFLGKRGRFDGDDIIDVITRQDATAAYIAGKLYRYFVRADLDAQLQRDLGARLRELDFEVAAFLEVLFMSRDFYSVESIATRIKGPVELVVSTYRKMGLQDVPGVPDFNVVTGSLGQRLMHPPTVAGWSHGRSWITPGLLFDRGNFVLDVVFHDIGFVPPDRMGGYQIRSVHSRLRSGMTISDATKPAGMDADDEAMMAASNLLADRDEAFNTRYGSYRGWQMAVERVKPIARRPARLDLAGMVLREELATPDEVVAYLARRFLSVPLAPAAQRELSEFFARELGTRDVRAAATYLEDPLRLLLHVLLSTPEYQLG